MMNEDIKKLWNDKFKRMLSTWGVTFLFFGLLAGISLRSLFEGVSHGYGDTRIIDETFSLPGTHLMFESWTRYPDYAVGLVAVIFLAMAGMAWSVYNMHRAYKE